MPVSLENYYAEKPALSQSQLSRNLQLSHVTLQPLLSVFETDGLIAKNDDDSPGYLPALPFDQIPVARAIHLIRKMYAKKFISGDEKVNQLMLEMDQTIDEHFETKTLKSLVE